MHSGNYILFEWLWGFISHSIRSCRWEKNPHRKVVHTKTNHQLKLNIVLVKVFEWECQFEYFSQEIGNIRDESSSLLERFYILIEDEMFLTVDWLRIITVLVENINLIHCVLCF